MRKFLALAALLLAASGELRAQTGVTVVPPQGLSGGGIISGTFTGGPTATISAISETGATVTVTASPCLFTTNSAVIISGLTGAFTPYNSPGGPSGVQAWVVSSGCSGGLFQYINS